MLPATVETPKTAGKLSPPERLAVSEIGQRFRRQGWDGSDAYESARAIGKCVNGKLSGAKVGTVARALRSGFVVGSLESKGSHERYAALSESAMGESFVASIEALLSGETFATKRPAETL